MKKPIEGEHWYFVGETGDPVFYDERGYGSVYFWCTGNVGDSEVSED